ncbi:ninein-like protein isoform X2 [Limulus polyphemus]|uniref:Ninein-like protein isoform X2 n=1 Tax=Limulus polyphemus TaxID=6850 RepID=A0ABM1S1J3_LIMPO|nr:ninein-like protein isoform X2 [Limulus polyphemus]
MEEDNSQDTYVAQLREVFESCDTTGTGYLGQDEMTSLCQKLQLTDQVNIFVKHLLGSDPKARIAFHDFKEGFISLLTQSVDIKDEEEGCDGTTAFQLSDREVSPKLVLGNKKYGRRSRPESLVGAENETQTDYSDSAVLYTPDNTPNMMWISSPKVNSSDLKHTSWTERRSIYRRYNDLIPKTSICYSPVQSVSSTPEHRLRNTIEVACTSQTTNTVEMDPTFSSNEKSAEEFLKSIWQKMDVGRDGYLNLEELTSVCEHIGMEMSDDVVTQLFDKLDCDQDGRISFEELLQGLFQHGGPSATNVSSYSCDTPLEGSPVHKPEFFKSNSGDDRQMAPGGSESGVFSSIDPDNSGYADASSVVELWQSLGLSEGMQFLKELGYNTNLKVNLQDLTVLLEEELTTACQSSGFQFSLTTYLNELQYLKTNYEQVKAERNKLRVSLAEANSRAALLAQEVDDHHAKLEKASQNKLIHIEKRYQEQLRDLQEELQKERDSLTAHTSRLKKQHQEELELVRDEENKLRSRLSTLVKENSRLESEILETTEKFSEAKKLNNVHQKEIETVGELKEKIAELESGRDILQNQQYQSLLQECDQYKKQNKELQDHNDELTLEVENLRQQLTMSTRPQEKKHKRTGSWLSDYNKGISSGSRLKRRGSDSSTDDNSGDESPKLGKIRRRIHLTPEVSKELPQIPFEIEKMKESHQDELEKLKNNYQMSLKEMEDSYRSRVSELEAQLLRQADLDKDQMDISLDGCVQMDALVQRLQEELDQQQNMTETLKSHMQLDLEEIKKQLEDEIRTKEQGFNEKQAEIEKLQEQYTLLLDLKDKELNKQIEVNRQLEIQKQELQKKLEAEILSSTDKEQKAETNETSKINKEGKEDATNFRNGASTCSTELNPCIKSLKVQLQSDLEALVTLLNSNLGQKAGGDDAFENKYNEKLDAILLETLSAVDNHLEKRYLQKQEKIKEQYEEELKQLRQEHMLEQVELELQYKEEFHKLRHNKSQHLKMKYPSQTDVLLKDLYVENANLSRELQNCEERLQKAEQNSTRLQYKCKVLSKLLKDITRTAVL